MVAWLDMKHLENRFGVQSIQNTELIKETITKDPVSLVHLSDAKKSTYLYFF